jgi:phage baseplate assembly protein W
MPVEMTIPFALTPDGRVSTESDPYRRALQRVIAMVGSMPGERVMDLDFGVNVSSLVFSEDDTLGDIELAEMITTALAVYEPGVRLVSAKPILDVAGDGISSVDLKIELTEDPSTGFDASRWANTATISPGGTVTETIRG